MSEGETKGASIHDDELIAAAAHCVSNQSVMVRLGVRQCSCMTQRNDSSRSSVHHTESVLHANID